MATALQSFRITARSCNCRPLPYQFVAASIGTGRPFSTTPRWRDGRVKNALSKVESSGNAALRGVDAEFRRLEKEDEADEWLPIHQRIHAKYPPFSIPPKRKKLKETFLNMGDPEPWEDEDFMVEEDEDDITALAHGELEQHREMRHYARLAAWEMPLLTQFAKPYQPPTADMPLRFRYTTFMGEQHPSEKKVVLEFSPADMPDLLPWQMEKLKKLAGVRYNPETNIIKMSCEMFETQAQNKRYLGDVVGSLLTEARDATDKFEDVPLDTRHHHFKQKPKFPRQWALTEERQKELAAYRAQIAEADQKKALDGQLIDGVQLIEAKLRAPPVKTAVAEMAMAGKGQGKFKKLSVRR